MSKINLMPGYEFRIGGTDMVTAFNNVLTAKDTDHTLRYLEFFDILPDDTLETGVIIRDEHLIPIRVIGNGNVGTSIGLFSPYGFFPSKEIVKWMLSNGFKRIPIKVNFEDGYDMKFNEIVINDIEDAIYFKVVWG